VSPLDSRPWVSIRRNKRDYTPPRLAVRGGWFVGQNSGEFGGSLTYHDSATGRVDTILIDNPVALLPTESGLTMVAGLGHMGSRVGHVVGLIRGPGASWTHREVANLRTAPEVVVQVDSDTLLITTSEGVIAVSLGTGTIRQLYRNEEWYQVYATSLVRTGSGDLYVGMRRAVAHPTRTSRGYKERWLVPADCPRQRPDGTGYGCRCGH
jgi:hypothetical protein